MNKTFNLESHLQYLVSIINNKRIMFDQDQLLNRYHWVFFMKQYLLQNVLMFHVNWRERKNNNNNNVFMQSKFIQTSYSDGSSKCKKNYLKVILLDSINTNI
jgi:hypothetical protein